MFYAEANISRSIEEGLQNAEELLKRAQGKATTAGLESQRGSSLGMQTIDVEINSSQISKLQRPMLRDENASKDDDILQSTLARFRGNVIDVETTPPKKALKSQASASEILEEDPDKTPKASKILAEKNVMTDLSPIQADDKPVQRVGHELDNQMQQQLDSIEGLQTRLHSLSQSFVNKQRRLIEEQSEAVHFQAVQQLRHLQELQDEQVNYQLKYMNKMREAAQMESHLGSLQDKENVHHRATSVSQGHVFTSSMPKNNDIEVQEIHQLRKELLSSSHVSKRFSKSASPDNHRPSKRQEAIKAESMEINSSFQYSPLDEILTQPSQISKTTKTTLAANSNGPVKAQPKKSRAIVGEALDYKSLHRLLGDLHKKWSRVLDPQVITSTEDLASKEELLLKSSELDEDILNPKRIKSLVAKKLEQAKFEKVSEDRKMSQVLSQFRPPDSEANVHVNQLHRGQHIPQKPNKAIKRQVVGKPEIIESVRSVPFPPAPSKPAPVLRTATPAVKPPKKKMAPKSKEYVKTVILESEIPSRGSPSPPKESRSSSPLRPPNFYNVRLSNAPIFLRRTTVRPPSLNFLDRRSPSPKRVVSPTRSRPESRVEFKSVEKEIITETQYEPEPDNRKDQIDFSRSIITEKNIIQAKRPIPIKSDGVQTLSSKMDGMTQVTPVVSTEVSQISEAIQTVQTPITSKMKQHLEKALQKASIETQYSSPNKDASCQYSLASEKSEHLEIQFDNTRKAKPVPKDPEFKRFAEEEANLSTNLESKIANWIQNEVLLRMLAKEDNQVSISLPVSTQTVPEKGDAGVQMVSYVDAGVQAKEEQFSNRATSPPLEAHAKQSVEMVIQTDIVPEHVKTPSPQRSILIENAQVTPEVKTPSHNLEEALYAKLSEEAANRARFLEELERQRKLDAAERDIMRQDAENEKKEIFDEIQKLREEARNRSFQEAEEKIQSFMSWQNNIELALTRVENNQSPTKLLLESREIQTQLEVKPQLEEKKVQSDNVVVETHDAAEQVSLSSSESIKEPEPKIPRPFTAILEKPVEVVRQKSPKKQSPPKNPILIGVEKEIIYEQTSKNLTEEHTTQTKKSSETSHTTSTGTSILSTMLSEGEVITHLYSEGEVIGTIERGALMQMTGEPVVVDEATETFKTPRKKTKTLKKKDDQTSLGEATHEDILGSPGELAEDLGTEEAIIAPAHVVKEDKSSHSNSNASSIQVTDIEHSQVKSFMVHDSPEKIIVEGAESVKASIAWQDSSNISESAIPSSSIPKTPSNRTNDDESQSQLGSLSSVSQRTAESVSTPSFSVSDSDRSHHLSPLARKAWDSDIPEENEEDAQELTDL